MSKIISLTTTNYKRARHVEIRPDADGNLVIVSGKNGQGKSSVLDSIAAALGGVNAKATPRPIHDGEDRAEIILETEDLIVTRTFTEGGSRLKVASQDGATYSKGQAKLDELIGRLSLDPLAFTQLSDREQVATLLDLVDLPFDPTELDAQRKTIFDQRTEVGRQGKAIGDVTVDPNLPAGEQSATDLINQIREAQATNAEVLNARANAERYRTTIARLQQELHDAEEALVRSQAVADQETVDTSTLEQQLATLEDTNSSIRANNVARGKAQEQARLRKEYKALSAELEAMDKRKADGLASAEFPVDGLGFDESGVTFQGVPFKQASSAEQIRVSLAMAIALNPGLR
ncbi:MAG: AAA family ATPase, partial [Galactobacter sp.]